jgi:hypothetical protein
MMLPREEKYIYDWETNRGKGKWRYILLTTFVWGTLVPFVVRLINIVTHNKISLSLFSDEFLSKHFFFLWIKCIVGFFLFAFGMWHLSFKKYKELKHKQVSQKHYQRMD